MSEVKIVPTSSIEENPVALRAVNKESASFLELVDSVSKSGILNPILVRPAKSEDGDIKYRLVDGLHRFTAAQEAGLAEIPVLIKDISEVEALDAQLMTNIHKVETKPVEYARQLLRILSHNPTMTESELASKLSKSPAWLANVLGLNKLDENVKSLVNEGKINVSNAFVLAKLPIEEQPNWIQQAIEESPSEFTPKISNRAKEIREAKRQGRSVAPMEFRPIAHLQKLSTIKAEFERPTAARNILNEVAASTPQDGWDAAIAWVLNLDPLSVAAQKQKEDERKAKLAEEKAKRQAEKAQQAAAAAATATV